MIQDKSTRNKYLEIFLIFCSVILTVIYLLRGMAVQEIWLNMLMGALLGSFPLLLILRLYGFRRAMIAYTICLGCMLFLNGQAVLLLVYPLAAVLFCAFLSEYGWLDSVGNVICAAFLTAVPMGILVIVLEYVIKNRIIVDSVTGVLKPIIYCLPQFLLCYILVFGIRILFLSKGLIFKSEVVIQKEYKNGSLRSRILCFMIGGFFLLTVISTVATNILLPYFFEWSRLFQKKYSMAGNDAFVPEIPLNSSIFFRGRISELSYQLNWGAFDLALFLYLCLFLVPVVCLAEWLLQRNILTPVHVMDYGMEHYLTLVKEDRLVAEKYVRELVVNTGDELEALHKTLQKVVAETEKQAAHEKEHQKHWEARCVKQASTKAAAEILQAVSGELQSLEKQTIFEVIHGYISELTDAAQLSSNKLLIQTYEYPFPEMFGEVAVTMAKVMQSKQLNLDVSIDETLPVGLYGDETRISQILRNILSYVARYTDEGSICLSVRGTKEEDLVCLHFEIDDTVMGISDTNVSKLVLAETALKENDIQKTGVSMYVAKCLLEMLGSKLHVASVCENGVARKVLFYFDLWQKVTDETLVGALQENIQARIQGIGQEIAGEAEQTAQTTQIEVLEVLENVDSDVLEPEVLEPEETDIMDSQTALEQLPEIAGMDWNVAWMHMQDEKLMARAVVGFIKMIPIHAKRLEDCYYRLPWKNAAQDYYEQIKRMRIDAQTVGIFTLSGMAGLLEESARERKLEIVWAMHGIFLKTWYSYDKKLRKMIEEVEEVEEI